MLQSLADVDKDLAKTCPHSNVTRPSKEMYNRLHTDGTDPSCKAVFTLVTSPQSLPSQVILARVESSSRKSKVLNVSGICPTGPQSTISIRSHIRGSFCWFDGGEDERSPRQLTSARCKCAIDKWVTL